MSPPAQEVDTYSTAAVLALGDHGAAAGPWVKLEDHQRFLQARDNEFDEATQELAAELADARREADEAESKLPSVVEELERRAASALAQKRSYAQKINTEEQDAATLANAASEDGRAHGLNEALQLLRGKGTEQAGVDNGADSAPVVTQSGDSLNSRAMSNEQVDKGPQG